MSSRSHPYVDGRSTADTLDQLADTPVIVTSDLDGSPHDLDVVLEPRDAHRLAARLGDGGFARVGGRSIKRVDGGWLVVDLRTFARVGIPDDEWAGVVARATLAPNRRSLYVPDAADALLLLAVRTRSSLGRDPRAAVRAAAIADDLPAAWTRASARAAAWGVDGSFDLMRRAASGAQIGAFDAARSVVVEALRSPRARAAILVAARRRIGRLRPPRCVALSGIDGAGKSTAGAEIAGFLRDIGIDTSLEWSRLGGSRSLDIVAAFPKAVLRRRGRQAGPTASKGHEGPAFRQEHTTLDLAWVSLVALVKGIRHRGLIWRHWGRARIVVSDRYVLDSLAHMAYRYPQLASRVPKTILRLAAPKPIASFLLVIDPELSLRRKPEGHSIDRQRTLARAYGILAADLGARTVDATLPVAEVVSTIAVEVLRVMSGDRSPRSRAPGH